jgi:hypothetical protein
MTISTTYKLNAGDYLDVCVRQNTGAAVNLLAGGEDGIEFMAQKIA